MTLTIQQADAFAAMALGHVTREYPHKLDHVLAQDADARTPRDLHPIFFGSFDWHSCVHGYWMLARLLRRFSDMSQASAIIALFDDAFTEKKVGAELAYLARPSSAGFERTYGWAWLLKLAAELRDHPASLRWGETLGPFAQAFAQRFVMFLPKLTYAIRAGTHANTAFALLLAADYADDALMTLMRTRAQAWFGDDRDAPAWEPSGDDFLSPTLVEAACMKRLLPAQDFAPWFAAFLPRLPDSLTQPTSVSDRSDGKIAHLDGLNLSRAWCMRMLGGYDDIAERHLAAALPHLAGDYMGEHWLATFAVLALDGT